MLKVVGNESAQDETDGRSLLDEIAREGARRMLPAVLETEVAAYLEAHRDERDDDGHALVVRNGKGRTRKATVGAGCRPSPWSVDSLEVLASLLCVRRRRQTEK